MQGLTQGMYVAALGAAVLDNEMAFWILFVAGLVIEGLLFLARGLVKEGNDGLG